MKPQFNKTWLVIALVIIGNITIFYFMSQSLESYVADNMIEHTQIPGISGI
ncbi:MAG: hypothetical protein UR85_C0004G0018 [Candidatus Nomurabacteria bacterium GW2011_GWF2_35_66]|uniref:Uncharacterized protein n=1 Tax=Candidatus Nomurabacteria bacterium GW2011_GWE1_35_16 TaxID=1618761 RepID=A0A0G0BBD4_9BACT|nr:MAG: hypothetical protein UR55_C0002G0017 [Candidatus Nomurabacteria bacterium GW2011_GWF1_34_20]KKP63596.1 MAG: hypothetical protein UR57_C0002G0017 [Candidatus Nomurabacteria bacterium GW2011_GWE2_34_25]KKP66798.1 MAG: hypothetical protein UR64_C0002G0014 [Candidatus Nomurabacteria bacterium GW2011_GWE1_35_16]KKP83424.1 MAG: hypothetical protein UR85_C0004G0018 [Candidatus Nomurabacteria bacterium GW2011_GWF2_35_66]